MFRLRFAAADALALRTGWCHRHGNIQRHPHPPGVPGAWSLAGLQALLPVIDGYAVVFGSLMQDIRCACRPMFAPPPPPLPPPFIYPCVPCCPRALVSVVCAIAKLLYCINHKFVLFVIKAPRPQCAGVLSRSHKCCMNQACPACVAFIAAVDFWWVAILLSRRVLLCCCKP